MLKCCQMLSDGIAISDLFTWQKYFWTTRLHGYKMCHIWKQFVGMKLKRLSSETLFHGHLLILWYSSAIWSQMHKGLRHKGKFYGYRALGSYLWVSDIWHFTISKIRRENCRDAPPKQSRDFVLLNHNNS